MTTVIQATCSCGSIGRTDIRQCPEHFHIWNGDKQVTSVGKVLRLWPQKPCNACGAQSYRDHREGCPVFAKIENAQDRGKEVDALFSAYVVGKLQRIPAGTRKDVWKTEPPFDGLLQKLIKWFDKQGFKNAEAQVLVADNEIGGIMDLRLDGLRADLKSVYNIEDKHLLQTAAYAELDHAEDAAVIHVTERFKEPKIIEITPDDFHDWFAVRSLWSVVQRRTA